MELAKVPKELHSYYSAHGYLSQVLNHPFDILPNTLVLFDNLGCFYDTFVEVPSNIKERAQYLHVYIKASGSWVIRVHTGCWNVNKKGVFLECLLFCVRPDRNIYKFKIEFRARGATVVHTWNDRFLEN
jgi:hypothetical protein